MALSTDWRVSSFTDRGNCVEVRLAGERVEVRHSHWPDGPTISYSRDEWDAFISGVKAREFDLD